MTYSALCYSHYRRFKRQKVTFRFSEKDGIQMWKVLVQKVGIDFEQYTVLSFESPLWVYR